MHDMKASIVAIERARVAKIGTELSVEALVGHRSRSAGHIRYQIVIDYDGIGELERDREL
jgi:hypothetical protein